MDQTQSNEFRKILNKYFTYVKKGGFYNFTTLLKPFGRWVIPRSSYRSFLTDIRDKEFIYAIGEVQQEYSQLFFDIDFKEEYKDGDVYYLYDIDDVKNVFNAIKNAILKVIKGTPDCSCLILTKDPYVKDGYVKHGFHIQFSRVFSDTWSRKEIFKIAQKNTDIDLDNIINKPWLLYGSCKNPESGRYEVSYSLNHDGKKKTVLSFMKTHKCVDIETEEVISYKNKPMNELLLCSPMFAHGDYIYDRYNISKPPPKERIEISIKTDYTDEDRELCKILVNGLSPHRSKQYGNWTIILCAIFNIFGGTDEGLELAKTFSQQCEDKYDELDLETRWSCIESTSFGIEMLGKMFNKDNRPPLSLLKSSYKTRK